MKLISISKSHISLMLCFLCVTTNYASDIPNAEQKENTDANQSCCKKVTFKAGIYTLAAACGGFAGFIISAFIASNLTPQKAFPTPREHFAALEIYHQHLGFYTSILAPSLAGVGAAGTALVDKYRNRLWCNKNNDEDTPLLP